MAKVLYKQGTKADYLGLPERLDTALYFCIDTRELYKGNDLFTDGVRFVASFSELPEFTAAADGKLYYCNDTGCGYVVNDERNDWIQVIFGVDNETIGISEIGLLKVKAVPLVSVTGLEERLAEIEQKIITGGGDTPIATQTTLGIVKGSDEISVGEDGSLSVSVISQEKVGGLEERLNSLENNMNWGNI